jgi:hypothetical protein
MSTALGLVLGPSLLWRPSFIEPIHSVIFTTPVNLQNSDLLPTREQNV